MSSEGTGVGLPLGEAGQTASGAAQDHGCGDSKMTMSAPHDPQCALVVTGGQCDRLREPPLSLGLGAMPFLLKANVAEEAFQRLTQ